MTNPGEIISERADGMKTALHTITGIASICIWMYASYFALNWFGHIADGTISYNGRVAAVVVPA